MTTTHSLEVTIAHLNLLARALTGADSVMVDRFGIIEIQGAASALAELPATLMLTRREERDHGTSVSMFRIWDGLTSSAFGSFKTRLCLVEPVEMPADCYAAELT